jgi:PAS domain-containing protein
MDARSEERHVLPDPRFPEGLGPLGDRIVAYQSAGDDAVDPGMLTELEVAYEELRVAEEEVRTQQDEIGRLAESHQTMQWQHERLLEMLPVPVVTTDHAGIVRSANAAAAALVGIPLPQLLRKPLPSFVHLEDRPAVRAELATIVSGGRWSRVLKLLNRAGSPVLVETTATADVEPGGRITWMFLAPVLGGERRVPGAITLPEALVHLAGLATAGLDEATLVPRCARLCQDVLGDGVSLSVTAGDPSAPEATGSTSRPAQALDGAQIAHGEGPCVTAFAAAVTVTSPELRADPRWPRLAADPRSRDAGGAIAVPLRLGDEVVGALNVYGEVGDPVDQRLVETAELLAAGIAAVFHEIAVRTELRRTAADLERALESRAMIEQAKGIVIADRGCSPEAAFEHLVHLSSTQHLKLREVARRLVEARSTGSSPPDS